MTEWELCKCFRAFNTVHEKLSSVGLSPPYPKSSPNPNPNSAGRICWGGGGGGGNLPLGNFTGDNFPITVAIFQKAIFQSKFKQCFSNKN